ncbi:MAG TPA: zinc metalloprotease HtpX [Bryobacteraceae bacterium]|nr:zinc metalloprotease HtpX [Bryobacteraceae bacterium]
MNTVKTALLLGLLSGLVLFGGEMIGGRAGLQYGLMIAVAMNFFSYFFSDKLALMMYRAQPITPEENSEAYARVYPLVQGLRQRMGLPVMPKLWLIPEEQPNAFATGRNPRKASVAFTVGILNLMTDRELEGVVAHELGHVLHRDILISSVAATLAAAITFLARMAGWAAMFGGYEGGYERDRDNRGSALGGLLMIVLAPIAAMLIQLAISRSREFSADEASAKYTGSPDGLISALGKLERGVQRIPMEDATPATAHMFILNPFRGDGLMRLFSTHPSTEERIARLEAMHGDALRRMPRVG